MTKQKIEIKASTKGLEELKSGFKSLELAIKIKTVASEVELELKRLEDPKAKMSVFDKQQLHRVQAAIDTLDRCLNRK